MVFVACPILALKECQSITKVSDIPCNIISLTHPANNCNTYNMSIYNGSNVLIANITWGDYPPTCNLTFSYNSPQTYYYNSSVMAGVITVEGDDDMILILGIFLLLINIAIAYLPFMTRFSKSEAGDYVVKRMIWIAAILLLWFNMTMFRQLAKDYGIGVDIYLNVYWWILTLAVFACVFLIAYVALVGALKLIQESKLKKRMGDY